jgi:uncharacterized protein (DUF1330 family)
MKMENAQVIKQEVIFGNHALIKQVKQDVNLDQPVYAVNWFDTRMKWMYDFYNLLAAQSVYKIGGKVFFKGQVVKKLAGSEKDSRNMLLIVNYPSVIRFMDLVKDKFFVLVSVLRELAVKDFSFGFTQRLDSQEPLPEKKSNFDKSKVYAMHHFRTEKSLSEFLPRFNKIASENAVKIHYAGQLSSRLFSENQQGKETPVPCLMDGLLLYEAEHNDFMHAMIAGEEYQIEIAKLDSSYIALIKRTM